MFARRLLPVVLVVLHSGLVAARTHAHSADSLHASAPHLHACELLEPFLPAHAEDGPADAPIHDGEAVDLSTLMTCAVTPHVEYEGSVLAGVMPPPAYEVCSRTLSFPVGLPHSTAGPGLPVYLAFCTLII